MYELNGRKVGVEAVSTPRSTHQTSNAIVGFPLGQLERINESLHAAEYPELPFVLRIPDLPIRMHALLGTASSNNTNKILDRPHIFGCQFLLL